MARVGLILDNPRRDLFGILLVANELVEQGHEAVVIPMYQQWFDVPLAGLDAVVVNYIRPVNADLLRTARSLGCAVIVSDTEGGVLSDSGVDNPENWANFLKVEGLAPLISTYCFWGERVHRGFLKFSGIVPSQLVTTGCPRFDLCHEKWRPLLTENADRRDFILVNTNFSAVNPKFSRSAIHEREAFIAAGWEPSYVDELLGDLKLVFQNYLDVLEQLAIDFPNETLFIRPHPFESDALYRDRFSAYSNVTVDGQGNVMHRIAAAKVVLHLNCGSSVETNMLGKLPVSLEFLNTPIQKKHTPLPSSISFCAASYEHLAQIIRDPISAYASYPAAKLYSEFISAFFGELDGRAAFRVAAQALRAVDELRPPVTSSRWIAAVKGGAQQWKPRRTVLGIVTQVLGSQLTGKLRSNLTKARADKKVSRKFIQEQMNSITKVSGKKSNRKVSHLKHPITQLPLESLLVKG